MLERSLPVKTYSATSLQLKSKPGDILQFQNAIFLGMNYWMILGTPDHTAIVFMVQGSDVMLLHQDVNGIRLVQSSTINLADLHSGTITRTRCRE